MKYYENNELVVVTYNIDATIERCSECPYCEHLSTGKYYCQVGQFNLDYCPDDYECYQP